VVFGLGLYTFNPTVGLLSMCCSVLCEQEPEHTIYRSMLLSRLKHTLVKLGVNRPTATLICEDTFEPKGGVSTHVAESPIDYALKTSGEYSSKMLILENVVLLLAGFSTVGLLTCYIITYIYADSKYTATLFAAIPFVVFVSRVFIVQKTGRFMGARFAELTTITLLALFLATQFAHYMLLALIAVGGASITWLHTKETKRRVQAKRENAFLQALIRGLSRRGLSAKASVLRALCNFYSLKAADLSLRPSLPGLLEYVSTKTIEKENRVVLQVFSKALSAVGYTPSWFKASWRLLRVSQRLANELNQQLAKNVLVTSVMFAVSALSITILTGTVFFNYSLHNTALNTVPTFTLDAGLVGFSYIYRSDTLYTGLVFTILLGELALKYAI
jgi:hypothetical protein